MKIIYILLLFIMLMLLLIPDKIFSQDTSYVTPDELEEGWGLYWTDPWTEYVPNPKTIIIFLQVSPDGKWLFWQDDFGLQLMNLQTREVNTIDRFLSIALWLPNSKEILYGHGFYPDRFIVYYNIYSKERDTVRCPTNDPNCSFGSLFGLDGNAYFAYPNGRPAKDSVIYRMMTDSSRKTGYPVYEPYVKGYDNLPSPMFPPNSMYYFLDDYPPTSDKVKTGFDVIRNLDYNGRSKIRLNPPDTSWEFNGCNNSGSLSNAIKPMEIGPRGDVYIFLSYRAKKELESGCNPKYWDSSTIAARHACGWYRIDTSGNNLVQLVKSWTYGMGGISITADGNSIYYGTLEKDTNAAIWRMDRFGKNKELIIKLDPLTSVDEDKESISSQQEFLESYVIYDELRVTWRLAKPGGASLMIYDCIGNIIKNEIVNSTSNVKNEAINIQSYSTGLYFLCIKSKNKILCNKFVIVK